MSAWRAGWFSLTRADRPPGGEDLFADRALAAEGVPREHPPVPVEAGAGGGGHEQLGLGLLRSRVDRLMGEDDLVLVAAGGARGLGSPRTARTAGVGRRNGREVGAQRPREAVRVQLGEEAVQRRLAGGARPRSPAGPAAPPPAAPPTGRSPAGSAGWRGWPSRPAPAARAAHPRCSPGGAGRAPSRTRRAGSAGRRRGGHCGRSDTGRTRQQALLRSGGRPQTPTS